MRYISSAVLVFFALMMTSCAVKKQGTVIHGDDVQVTVDQEKETQATTELEAEKKPPKVLEVPELKGQETLSERKRHHPVLIRKDETETDRVAINFDNTDIHTVIESFGKLMGINYIVSPGITGTVTIQSNKKFSSADLFQVFLSVLELNSLTAVKDGNFFRIVPIDTAKQQPVDIKDSDAMRIRLDSSFVTQILTLDHVKASEAANILRGFMSRGTDIVVYEPANMLIITALPKTLLKFMKIVEALDLPDVETDTVKTFIYYVENGEAKKLEGILKGIFDQNAGRKPSVSTVAAPKTSSGTMSAVKSGSGDISIMTYEDINALIIKCSPRDYLSVLDILKKLDVSPKQPRQVLIEVMIAEVSLTKNLEYGLEWLIKTGRGDTIGYTSSPVTITGDNTAQFVTGSPGGFAAVVSGKLNGTDFFSYVLKTLEGKTDVNVLASPLVLATDNKKAEITIGSEIPTATSTTSSTEGISTTTQIQYRSVGTLLTVTPEVTDKRSVSMEISVESSDVIEAGRTIGTGTFPQFQTRRATTSAVVSDGHTLFLGGLISNKRTSSRNGVPFLSRIPIIGLLFGSRNQTDARSELFVVVTPHIVDSQEEADEITRGYQDRIKIISKRFDKSLYSEVLRY